MSEETEMLGLNNEDVREYIELLGKVTREFMKEKKTMKEGKILRENGDKAAYYDDKPNAFEYAFDAEMESIKQSAVSWHEVFDFLQQRGLNEYERKPPYTGIQRVIKFLDEKLPKQNSFTIKADKDSSVPSQTEEFGRGEEYRKKLFEQIKQQDTDWQWRNEGKQHYHFEHAQKQKDWKILSFGVGFPTPILKVKRLSDNEVFSVGDEVYEQFPSNKHWVINKFEIKDNTKMLALSKEWEYEVGDAAVIDHWCDLKKAKQQPLFKTEDGKDIYEGDEYWFVLGSEFYILKNIADPDGWHGKNNDCKYFSTEEAAKIYILMNKPCLSLNDVCTPNNEIINLNFKGFHQVDKAKLVHIAKERIK